jgi:DNA helicase-2/ATP-dependent DNA helicase PcrA
VLVGGLSFFDRREVKDLVAYLRVLANPHDEVSLLRIINTPARGIGTATVQTLLETAVGRGVPFWTVLPEAVNDGRIPHYAGERIEGFRRLIEAFRARLGQIPLADLLAEVVRTIEYKSELERVHKDPGEAEARWQAVEEMMNAVAQYEQRAEQPSLLGFLEETVLASRDDLTETEDQRRPHSITLMTLHSAKGLEFLHVYMVGMEEGLLPHVRSVEQGGAGIEEERRLCYVGVTRARETLTLSRTRSRMKWGQPRPQIPSRFLMEMRGETERAQRAAAAAAELFARPATAEAVETKSSRRKQRRQSNA